MSTTENDLITLISEKVIDKWKDKKEPYLLSSVGSDCKGIIELKEVLNGIKLKEWVNLNLNRLSADILAHPTQKEKIGLIPKGEKYEYGIQTSSRSNKIHLKPTIKTKKEVTIAFLSILADLPTEDADKIIIPTSVLSKLLGE